MTIKYFLHEQEKTELAGGYLPTSTSTIWRILDQHQRIIRPGPPEPDPLEPGDPMAVWQIDFKDVTTVHQSEQTDKRQHLVETLNLVDTGTSILVDNPARLDFNAETTIRAMAEVLLQQQDCPRQITVDRDPRFVASASGSDFPAPFVRFLACLGIKANICPPQRPDRNGYIERYHRTYKYETILVASQADLHRSYPPNEFRLAYCLYRPDTPINDQTAENAQGCSPQKAWDEWDVVEVNLLRDIRTICRQPRKTKPNNKDELRDIRCLVGAQLFHSQRLGLSVGIAMPI